ncbi:serine/threonine protein kinase [Bacillus pseudomycoides]|uniref:Serine/threonine protein kinase n=1 Tax=Bacillus pseudomycoides TaxID=64104 RepID=A0A2B6RS41_9BACI|nr:serine/threonine protein kinase [Bacillus pseudomycoides]PDY46724.1 serine/threonine protein kinase [Bacillus pseudomycoides]PED70088.1 serine/threonine protein kinase [Bacillus pseudomycoides]PEI46694.1 serine/threonine protein kinase [Bacillus pseudomycoides]PEJ78562.1 serine/threonine protein kinase [Bacillus pseudomycoides]PEM22057.1 serine/threonine protein kinase [Bacillus pseudomycoides]
MNGIPITIHLDDVTFRLKEYQDFDWFLNLGKVFAVFDQQDSGNICFGIEKNGKRSFVKFAGAKTMEYTGDPTEAIVNLKQAMLLYEELKHNHLVELINHFEVQNGYVAIFNWFNGECLHSHWSFPPPVKYSNPDSPFYRYKQLSIEKRLISLDHIFSFHVHVEEKNYVAIDFYDGSILYDFETNTIKICDIDLYKRKPYINTMGRLWGSSRFMSPEEFELGAVIDGKTNVFNMGAIAFALVGGELDRSFTKWEAGKELYDVAARAVEKSRSQRYASVEEFYLAWEYARNK